VERNLNLQKTGSSYIFISRLNKSFLRTPARSNNLLSLKPLPPDLMLDTVPYVTSNRIFYLR